MKQFSPRQRDSRTIAKIALTALTATIALSVVLAPKPGRPVLVPIVSPPLVGEPPLARNIWTEVGKIDGRGLVGFSPDSRILAVYPAVERGENGGGVRLYDVQTGKEKAAIAVGWHQLETVCFSADGKRILAHDKERGMGVWDVATAEQLAAFRPPTVFGNWINCWFSPDGSSIIYQHYGERFPDDSLLNIRTVGAERDRAAITGEPWLIAFSPDGKQIATGTTATTHDSGTGCCSEPGKRKMPPSC